MDKWTEIKVEVPSSWADEVSCYLIAMGSEGLVTGGGSVDTFVLSEDEGPKSEIKAYFPAGEAAGKAAEIREYMQGLGLEFQVSVSDIENDDWAHKWKEFFKPEKITDRIVIKPTWEPYEAGNDQIVIEIDPGMAFGTGTHPTTRGCLRLIEEVVTKGGISSMLDVGTGTGILAIAAAKMGVSKIVATEIDATAVKVAEENILLNKSEKEINISGSKLYVIDERFNLVVANIIAEELIRLSKPLKERILTGGYLILSGIIVDKTDRVKKAFEGLVLEKELIEGEWGSLLFKKES